MSEAGTFRMTPGPRIVAGRPVVITLAYEVGGAGVAPGDVVEFVEDGGSFAINKRVTNSPFDAYVGHLTELEGREPDDLVRELRGHE